jgi:hypothetical protein
LRQNVLCFGYNNITWQLTTAIKDWGRNQKWLGVKSQEYLAKILFFMFDYLRMPGQTHFHTKPELKRWWGLRKNRKYMG